MFPGQMVPTIVSLVLPLSASRAHFVKKSAKKSKKCPFFDPPKSCIHSENRKKRPLIVILSPIPFGSYQYVSNATWPYNFYAKILIFAGENRLGAKTFQKGPFFGKKGKFSPKKGPKIEKNDFFKKVAEKSAGNVCI